MDLSLLKALSEADAIASSEQEVRQILLEEADRLQKEVVDTATAFAAAEKLDALLLECTDLSAFSAPVQRAIQIPVYDINTLVAYTASVVVRHDYL